MKYCYIGISGRLTTDGYEKLTSTMTYLNLLQNSNFIPLILPPSLEEEKLEQLLALCSAFILTGGDDLDPRLYLETNYGKSIVDSRIDVLDFQILNYATKHQLPLLGICRGLQAINVYFGGSLHQHLDGLSLFKHDKGNHNVKTLNMEWLPEVNDQIYNVHSSHHQAINKLGSNLEIIAISEDNYVEGIVSKDKKIIGLQWHIEQSPASLFTKTIIDYFFQQIHYSADDQSI